MILVDSSVWIDFFNGRESRQTDLVALPLRRRVVLLGDLILAARRALLTLPHADLAGQEIALASAQNYRLSRQRGVTIRKTIAVMIATFCIRGGHALLRGDRDFAPLAEHLGLQTA